MSVLSDHDLRAEMAAGNPLIWPPPMIGQIQPASIDLRMGAVLLVFRKGQSAMIDVRKPNPGIFEEVPLDDGVPFWLQPGEFVLGVTHETVMVPRHLVADLKGKSSLGRLGLQVHSTAGYVDPGWEGPVTLELSNIGPASISLYRDMWIAQLVVEQLLTPADNLYGSEGLGSKYTDADNIPQASRAYLG